MRVSPALLPLAAGLFLPAVCALANPVGPVSEIVAFGDSLSDSGNASIATFGAQPGVRGPGYYYRSLPGVPFQVGEFTNAPTTGGPTGVWVDQLAPKLGLSVAQPGLPPVGGTNYAVGSAVTGSTGLANVDSEVALFSSTHSGKASPTALYTVWAGANDILNITNPLDAPATGTTAADNLYKNILTLSGEGARYFIWANLPDLGKTPGAVAAGSAAATVASVASGAFDAQWAADLLKLQSAGIAVTGLDVASLLAAVEANPAQYGFSNVTGSAIAVPASDPNTYLFWDAVHPTTATDALLADVAFADLVPAPEPAAFGLAGLGICALLVLAKRVRRNQRGA